MKKMTNVKKRTTKEDEAIKKVSCYYDLSHFNFSKKETGSKSRTGIGNDFVQGLKKKLKKDK